MKAFALLMLVVGLVLGLLSRAVADGASSARVTAQPGFSVTLRPNRQSFLFDVRFHNPTSSVVKLGYGDCNFSYVVRVAGKQYTYPRSQPFAFPEVCTARLNAPSIAAHSTLKLFSVSVPAPLARALTGARSKFSGEFHFKYSLVGQPFTIRVYKLL